MTDAWKPYGEVEALGRGITLQYLRGPRKMGAHEVALPGGDRLRALPDSTTTARGRAAAVRQAVSVFGGHDDPTAVMCALVGTLVLNDATNLELNGEPVIEQGGGKWMVLLEDNGRMEARYVKGSE